MTHRDRSELVNLIRANRANLEYFFSKLEDASWLSFLLEEGFFSNPIAPQTGTTDDGQGWIQFPSWPESKYLARIASEAPELVAEAIERIPETSNPRVHEDIVTAASSLPASLAGRIALREQRWLAGYNGHLVSFPGAVAVLLAHLAEEGEVRPAFRLAGTLLHVSAAPESQLRPSRHRAIALVGHWEYGKILEKAWPPIMRAEPTKAFRFLCHRLDDVITIGFVEGSGFDPTYIWRSAIEDHAQNTGHSLLDTLVDAVRDTASAAAKEGAESRDMVLGEFARHDLSIFRRLELFVIARFGSADQAADALSDQDLIDDSHVWHEYAELLKARFGDLDTRQQAGILKLIAAGPTYELTAADTTRGSTEEQVEAACRHWRLERYVLIEDHLSGEAKADLNALLAEFAKPDHPTFHSVSSHWVGPTSPFSVEELTGMGPAGALEALRTWVPDGGPEDASPEGLGRILEGAVERDAPGFAEIAAAFADLDGNYVRGLLDGLAKAARGDVRFRWEPVLGLCMRLVIDEDEEHEVRADFDSSIGLGVSAARLLSEGLRDGDCELPQSERSRVWSIVTSLLDHPDPSRDRDGGHDPATLALNSVRGEAMHAAVRYGFWVERAAEADGSFRGIESLPELASAVLRRLDPHVDSSLAIRAVLGQWFAQFVRMDPKWAKSLVPTLFPSDRESAPFFSAAWNAYVVFNQAWESVFETLGAVYELAVERFEAVADDRYMAGHPLEHLGEHLSHLRFVGSIDLEPDGLFARFWSVAPAEIRTHVIRDVGWSLEHGNPELSGTTRDRIVETWEWIFDQSLEPRDSLSAFGAWFGDRQFEDAWLLEQGNRVLKLGLPLDPEHVVYEALTRMVGEHPREVVETLRLMIIEEREQWLILGSVDEVRQTLAAVLTSDDERTRADAVFALNLLGARGMNQFRDLMPKRVS